MAVIRYRAATFNWNNEDSGSETKNILLYFIANLIYFFLLFCDVSFIGYVLLTQSHPSPTRSDFKKGRLSL